MIKGIKYAKYYIDNELDGKIIKIDDGFTAITGYSWNDVEEGKMTIFNLIPEPQAEEYKQIVYSSQQQGEAYLNHEIRCKNGAVIDVNCYGEVYNDEKTGRSCSKILIIDVTEQQNAVTELSKKEEQLASQIEKIKFLTEDAHEIFIDYDIQRDYFEISRFVNGQYEIVEAMENYFNTMDKTIHEEDFTKLAEAFLVARNKKEKQVLDFRSKYFYGQYNWYRLIYANYINPKSGKSHIIGRVMDINDEKIASLRLEREVENDTLTGIYNRATTEKKINEILENNDARDKHTMLIVDIDYNRASANSLSREATDRILIKTSELLQAMFRQGFDVIGRIDGAVFVVFIRNTSDAFYVEGQCQELLRKIKTDCSSIAGEVSITGRIGIALGDETCATFKKIYKKADKALRRQYQKEKDGYSF